MSPISGYLIALILTVIVEMAIAISIGYRDKTSLFAIFLINLITNPAANHLIQLNSVYGWIPSGLSVLIVEIVVVVVEWGLLVYSLRKSAREMLCLSVAINASSYAFGLLIFRFWL